MLTSAAKWYSPKAITSTPASRALDKSYGRRVQNMTNDDSTMATHIAIGTGWTSTMYSEGTHVYTGGAPVGGHAVERLRHCVRSQPYSKHSDFVAVLMDKATCGSWSNANRSNDPCAHDVYPLVSSTLIWPFAPLPQTWTSLLFGQDGTNLNEVLGTATVRNQVRPVWWIDIDVQCEVADAVQTSKQQDQAEDTLPPFVCTAVSSVNID